MEIINRRQRMASVIRRLRREQECVVGVVPTMGALHEGHLSLVSEARVRCQVVVVTIFVNPAQFGPGEDFNRYPRDLTKDIDLLNEFNVDYVFAPPPEEIYPKNFSTYVAVEGLSDVLEGAIRPGHFRGVATVLAILFNTIRPNLAFFGQKDAQQTVVVKRMVRDLAFDTEIVVLPTIREEAGLARSSRNVYLSDEQRAAALALSRALQRAELLYVEGERDAHRLLEAAWRELAANPALTIEYVSLNDADTLDVLEKLNGRPAFLSLAVKLGSTRLIDNTLLSPQMIEDRRNQRAGHAE